MQNDTNNFITCSFTVDKSTYNEYKSIVAKNGENVKGNLVRYMKQVIQYDSPNAETILAFKEVQTLKEEPEKKTYGSFSEIVREIENA